MRGRGGKGGSIRRSKRATLASSTSCLTTKASYSSTTCLSMWSPPEPRPTSGGGPPRCSPRGDGFGVAGLGVAGAPPRCVLPGVLRGATLAGGLGDARCCVTVRSSLSSSEISGTRFAAFETARAARIEAFFGDRSMRSARAKSSSEDSKGREAAGAWAEAGRSIDGRGVPRGRADWARHINSQ